MENEDRRLATFLDKEEIRELAQLYTRGIDRRDWALVRSLYTPDGTDTHGEFFHGGADEFIAFLEASMPAARWTGHFIANHLISVVEDEGEGEVYALAYHLMHGESGEPVEDLMMVRYFDRYRRISGKWHFASRSVTFDMRNRRSVDPSPGMTAKTPQEDPSYCQLLSPLFQRGPQ